MALDGWVQNNVLACSVANSGMRDWDLAVPGIGGRAHHAARYTTVGNSLGFGMSVGVYCVQYSGSACLISMLVGGLFVPLGLGRPVLALWVGWHFRVAWRRCGRIQPQIFIRHLEILGVMSCLFFSLSPFSHALKISETTQAAPGDSRRFRGFH